MQVKNVAKYAVCVFLIVGLSSCTEDAPETPEEHVRAVISAIEAGIEDRDTSDIFDHVSQNYQDHRGKDRDDLRKLAQVYLFANQNIELIVHINSIEQINSQSIAVEATVTMVGTAARTNSRLTGLRMDNQRVSGAFVLEQTEWKLSSVSWERQSIF